MRPSCKFGGRLVCFGEAAMKKTKRRKIAAVVLSCLFVLFAVCSPFIGIYIAGQCVPAQYTQTYYGALANLYARLKNTTGKKIVVIGNSNVAFGVDSALAEKLLREAGMEYSVCNFGLYGALGTKMMCELAYEQIEKDDVVIFTPELVAQSLSTYFSVEEAWYALDGDRSMYKGFSRESKSALAAGYIGYTAKKLALYEKGTPAAGSGVYASSSFDERGDLKNYARPYNIMPDGVDVNNPIVFDGELFSADFVNFINGYAEKLQKKGARIYYSFSPMNAGAVAFKETEKLTGFYRLIETKLRFPLISNIEDYLLDKEWFYDSNYHLNENGMKVRTVRLVNDIKNQFGNTTKTDYPLPDKPVLPDADVEGEGDNSHADMFEYRLDGSYYTVVGLTEKGRNAEELIIPYQVDGIYVKAFLPLVFFDHKNIKSVTVQKNIHTLSNGSFLGCDHLKQIVLRHSEPSEISVGYELLTGAPQDCKIFVPKGALSRFENNYFWGRYAKQLQGYEE